MYFSNILLGHGPCHHISRRRLEAATSTFKSPGIQRPHLQSLTTPLTLSTDLGHSCVQIRFDHLLAMAGPTSTTKPASIIKKPLIKPMHQRTRCLISCSNLLWTSEVQIQLTINKSSLDSDHSSLSLSSNPSSYFFLFPWLLAVVFLPCLLCLSLLLHMLGVQRITELWSLLPSSLLRALLAAIAVQCCVC